MDVVSIVIAAVSAVVACAGAAIAWQARLDSSRAARAAESAEHRASRPRLLVEPEGDVQADASDVIYRVHNLDGPDLISVIVHRPAVGEADGGGVVYPVAATGRGDYAASAEIGPIPLAEYRRFTFSFGGAPELPEFRVRITCTAHGFEPWYISETLTTPRGPAQREAQRVLEERQAEEREAIEFRALGIAQRVSYYLRGGAGIGTGSMQWQMTTMRIAVRNDSDLTISNMRLVVGDDFIWSPSQPVPPGEELDVEAELNGALPRAPESEAGGAPFRSYPSRLEFTLGGRSYVREGDAPSALVAEQPS